MKTLLTTIKTIAVAMALVGFGNRATAQVITISDGSTAILNTAGTYSNTISSTTANSLSTAVLKIGGDAAKTINLTGTMSGYYGGIDFYNGSTLSLPGESGGRTINANRFAVSGTSAATTLAITSGGAMTIGGTAGVNVIDMGLKYGVFDFTGASGDLTITNGNIYFGAYNEPDYASYIKFPISTTAQRAIILSETGSKIYTNETYGTLYVDRSLKFDMAGATTGTVGVESSFIVAKTKSETLMTGALAPLFNNEEGIWTSPSVSSTENSGVWELKFKATFDPTFQLSIDNSYKGWVGLMTDVSTNESYSAKLLKNSALTSDRTFTNTYALNLQNYNITGTTNSITIGNDKTLTLGSTGTGIFSGKISFGGTGSALKVTRAGLLGTNFTISADGASGEIELNNVTDAIVLNNINFNSKLRSVLVTNGSVITFTTGPD
jgi:hypothetical protein